ncbi:MAG: PD-(D/E)XK nuclease family protein [Anaerolineales bacterium]|nr:PD-(D/E)XK nuclease family protein [Anaerolineales bacterium]
MAADVLTLSRGKLADFLACRRRFQLRYLRQLPWPPAPPDERVETAVSRGQQFHQLVQRHFLGLPVDAAALPDAQLRRWWEAFLRYRPALPAGEPLVEISLTVPVGRHLLLGRFDLLIVGEQNGAPFAHLFDWKTGRAQPPAALRDDWQTRLYLALLAEGGAALRPGSATLRPGSATLRPGSATLRPEHINLTYWYASDPDTPRTIAYDAAWHARNWADIEAAVAQIDAELAAGVWPLTDDLAQCRVCAYQVYCGRQAAGAAAPEPDAEPEPPDLPLLFEPELP